ncbi:ABC transporter permease [Chloroflexi bacterium TSY]|nr:ABC transporter permease [Chloroflexi bacterium TSY]
MKVLRYFGVAIDSIVAHKMRAILTMLGIIIGVAAVLSTMGIGSGAAADITESIESSGTNLLTVSAGSSGGGANASTLTMADASTLGDPTAFPDLALVAPQYTGNATLTRDGEEGGYQVVGTTETYAAVTNLDIETGTFFTADQVENNERVVVLGGTVASDLFGNAEPVGQTVRINNNLFQVIGTLEESGGGGFGSTDNQTFVPINVAQGLLFHAERYRGSYTVSTISIQVASSERIDAAELQIEQLLRLRHGLGQMMKTTSRSAIKPIYWR